MSFYQPFQIALRCIAPICWQSLENKIEELRGIYTQIMVAWREYQSVASVRGDGYRIIGQFLMCI